MSTMILVVLAGLIGLQSPPRVAGSFALSGRWWQMDVTAVPGGAIWLHPVNQGGWRGTVQSALVVPTAPLSRPEEPEVPGPPVQIVDGILSRDGQEQPFHLEVITRPDGSRGVRIVIGAYDWSTREDYEETWNAGFRELKQ